MVPRKNQFMNLRPTKGNLILEEVSEEKTTQSGIIIKKKEKTTNLGIVVAISDMNYLLGVKVIFSIYGPQEIMWEGKKYYIAKDVDILAIIQ